MAKDYIMYEPEEQSLIDMLDDTHDTVKIGGLEFSPSRVIKECDPIAFRCMLSDMPTTYKCEVCGQDHEEDEDDARECCDDD